MILQEFLIINWGRRAMTEKRGQITEICKTLSLCVSHQSPACRSVEITLLRFKLPLKSFAASLRSFNFVTLCPSNMYFLLYSTFKSVFVDKFGYPCTIDDLILKKKTKPISHTSEGWVPETSVTSKAQKTMYIELNSCIPLFTSNIMLQQEWTRYIVC